jgi:uncharacterized membrane protein YjdF
VDERTLLLGDWNRVVRDPIDVLRLTFLVGAAVFAITGDAKGTANLLIAAVAVVIARFVNLPRVYDLCFVLAMYLTGWGEALGLYDAISWYDNLVHFLVPFFVAPVVYIGLARIEVLPDPRDEAFPRHYAGIFVVTLALGLAIGAIWEMVEWSSDRVLGSNLSMGNDDTVGDLIADGLGSLCGALLLVAWTRYGWGSVRRIPGESRFEETSA